MLSQQMQHINQQPARRWHGEYVSIISLVFRGCCRADFSYHIPPPASRGLTRATSLCLQEELPGYPALRFKSRLQTYQQGRTSACLAVDVYVVEPWFCNSLSTPLRRGGRRSFLTWLRMEYQSAATNLGVSGCIITFLCHFPRVLKCEWNGGTRSQMDFEDWMRSRLGNATQPLF